jgi:hypothetical protein
MSVEETDEFVLLGFVQFLVNAFWILDIVNGIWMNFHFTEYVGSSEYTSVMKGDTKFTLIALQIFKHLEFELNHHLFLTAENFNAYCLLLWQ